MTHIARWGVLLLLLAMALLGCAGAASPASPNDLPAPQPTSTPVSAATEEVDEETAPLGTTPVASPSPQAENEEEEEPTPETTIVELVLDYVAAETGIARDELTVTAVEPMEWPNAALGCPKPDEMYIEVITPGYLVQLNSQDELFNIHTNQDGSLIVICDNLEESSTEDDVIDDSDPTVVPAGSDPVLPPSLSGEAAEAATKAIARVAIATGIDAASLSVTNYSQEIWPDSALGCRKAGQMYMQVITPGYKFVIQGNGETFNVHTDRMGNSIVICR